MLDPETGKHTIGECPTAAEKPKAVQPGLAQAVVQTIASTTV
jgi:hypothetical protein